MRNVLIFGSGWLGNKFAQYLGAKLSGVDITDKQAVLEEIKKYKPDVVLNAAGKTGRPNIDWCEDHKEETVASNITGPLILHDVCRSRNIFFTHLSSGCIYDGAPPRESGFTEEDKPNPVSFYSWTKVEAENLLKIFLVLILRLRMPIDSKPHPRNLITKLAGYKNVIDVENSVTVIDDLLFAAKKLIDARAMGIFNVVNPGAIKHKEILAWYKEIIDPAHVYTLIKPKELFEKGLAKAGRSNCLLDTTKLAEAGILLPAARQAVRDSILKYKNNI